MNERSVILEQDDQVCNKKNGKYIEDTVWNCREITLSHHFHKNYVKLMHLLLLI